MQSTKSFKKVLDKVQNSIVVQSIRDGLVSIIPVLIIGAFSLIINQLPITAYQTFIHTFLNGFIVDLFNIIYSASFGVLSIYMTVSISRSYMKIETDKNIVSFGAIVASVISFFILAGAYLPEFSTDSTGPKSVFLAIITGLGASALYVQISRFFIKKQKILFTNGANRTFNRMLSTLIPIAIVSFAFGLFNIIIVNIFNVESFKELIIKGFDLLFSIGEVGFIKGFFFVLLSSILWLFGIHGSDTLETVMQTYFVPGLEANQAAIAAGEAASTVLTKEFFDCFVLMGGCGATICLLITILIFSKNRARKSLGFTAAFPMIFNINELMVFGLPIVFNPIMLVPFLLTPLACYCISYLALSVGIVPLIANEVAWTTPIILGGYQATGSIAGSLLQLFNVIVGVLIYLPFVKLLDKRTEEALKENYDVFMNFFHKNEANMGNIVLSEMSDIYGDFAKDLCADIEHNYKKFMKIVYQPQYDYNGDLIGVEALLRYIHEDYGALYPPLVIKIAEECGILLDFEEEIFKKVMSEIDIVRNKFHGNIKVSINVTGSTIINPKFIEFLEELNETYAFAGKNICIEVTEQAALSFSQDSYNALRRINELGLTLAIDDFSMGQTSLHYLKYNLFHILKIDGSLVQGLFKEQNCKEIISSITQLAASLKLAVIAEFVDDEKQKETLHEIGCDNYQGFLFSKPISLE